MSRNTFIWEMSAMKIAISATAPSLEAPLDPRFGRAPWFLIVDPETLAVEEIANPAASSSGGAGIEAARAIAARAVTHVLTGRCGPNATAALSAANIVFIEGCTGTVREALERFLTAAPSAPDVGPAADRPAAERLLQQRGFGSSGAPQVRAGGGRGGCGRRRGGGKGRGGCGGGGGGGRAGMSVPPRTFEGAPLVEEAERPRRRLAEIEERLGTRGLRSRR